MGMKITKNTGNQLLMQQFYAMFMKRVIHSKRNKIVSITQLLMPLIFTIVAGIVVITVKVGKNQPPPEPMDLSLKYFKKADICIPYATNNISDMDPSSKTLIDGLTGGYKSFLSPVINHDHFEYINDNNDYKDDPTMVNYLTDIGKENMDSYNRDYMIAAGFTAPSGNSSSQIVGFFNNQVFHSVAISLNAVSNAILQHFTSSSYTLHATNHPLPKSDNFKASDDLMNAAMITFIVTLQIQFGMAFLTATFVVFLIKEKTSKSKHIQFVSGVHVANYWISTFSWDFINFMLPAFVQLIILAAFDIEPFVAENNLG